MPAKLTKKPTLRVCLKRDPYQIYIGRGSKWGNPFSHLDKSKAEFRVGSRDQAIEKYREWIKTQPRLLKALPKLRGKTLGCYCAPDQRCHGDVLIDLLEGKDQRDALGYDPEEHGAKCRICPLNDKKVVPPLYVAGRVKLTIVGEAPGRMEEMRRVPFVGPSGKLLDSVFERAGMTREGAHITNTLLCRPDNENQIDAARFCCAPRLFKELRETTKDGGPILALGAVATKALVGVGSILKSRGFIWTVPTLDDKQKRAARATMRKARKTRDVVKLVKSTNAKMKLLRNHYIPGVTVFPTLHPAFILRAEIWRSVLDIDVDRLARWFKGGGKLKLEDEVKFVHVRTAKALRREAKELGSTVTVDVETDGADPLYAKLLCVGIGDTKKIIIAHPVTPRMPAVFTKIFARAKKVVGHNIIVFDQPCVESNGVKLDHDKVEDTLVAHHAFASHLPKSLNHVTSVYCDSRPWKHLSRGGGAGKSEKGLPHHLSPEDLRKYNAQDVGLTALDWERMQPDLAEEMKIYVINKRIAQLCASMRIAGFRLDVGRARELSSILQRRKKKLRRKMRELTKNWDFSPSRPNDIRRALFGKFQAPNIRPTASGLPSTARAILEGLRSGHDKAAKLSDLVLKWRDADKTDSTYLSVQAATDGRVHADWRLGPVTGRLACKMMTLPRYSPDKKIITRRLRAFEEAHARPPTKDEKKSIIVNAVDPTDMVRECYIAAPGCVLVYFDLSQAEMRQAAYASNDPRFIHACKGDVHSGNAAVIFPDAAAEGCFDTPYECKEGRGKPYRDIAKNAGFAVSYLAEWETVYLYLVAHGFPVSPSDVRAMLDELHSAYAVYYAWVQSNIEFVQRNGYLRTLYSGRCRWFGQYPKPTEVANYPIQGGIADFMNERLPLLDDLLPKGCQIIAQIHDAAIIECVKSEAQNVVDLIKEVYDPPYCMPDRLPFVIPAEPKVGDRWSQFG